LGLALRFEPEGIADSIRCGGSSWSPCLSDSVLAKFILLARRTRMRIGLCVITSASANLCCRGTTGECASVIWNSKHQTDSVVRDRWWLIRCARPSACYGCKLIKRGGISLLKCVHLSSFITAGMSRQLRTRRMASCFYF